MGHSLEKCGRLCCFKCRASVLRNQVAAENNLKLPDRKWQTRQTVETETCLLWQRFTVEAEGRREETQACTLKVPKVPLALIRAIALCR